MKLFKYFPEMDYFFYNYWKENKVITFDHIEIPVIENNELAIPRGSFLELLFSKEFDYENYNICFKETRVTTFSKPIMDRILFSPSLIKIYITDSTADEPIAYVDATSNLDGNLFELQIDDINMLDRLLNYRKNLYVDLNLNYEDLNTNLSRLIFSYLDLMINGKFDLEENLISKEENTLENLFELYVINEFHRYIELHNMSIDTGIVEIRPVRDQKIFVKHYDSTADFQFWVEKLEPDQLPDLLNLTYDSSNLFEICEIYDSTEFTFPVEFYDSTSFIDPTYMILSEKPYKCDIIAVFKNGEVQDLSKFVLLTDGYNYFIDWSASDISVKEYDVFIVDYMTKVNSIDTAPQPSDLRVDDLNKKELDRLETDREVL